MRVVLVVAARKYTGAAAVAEHCCRALRCVGVDAQLLFQRGRNLEDRLAGIDWAFPELVKERSLGDLRRNLATLRHRTTGADAVLSHLPHDHLLCVAAGTARRSRLIRSVRNMGHLRRDPFHRLLMRRLWAVVLAHSEMQARLSRCTGVTRTLVLPVPIEDRMTVGADPQRWRRRLELPDGARVLGMVGKLARGRGFDLLLETAARCDPGVHVIVVGHGELQHSLEHLARRLGFAERVHWTGYQEQELPELYAACDVVLYTGLGSDHGHRAISEAQACGRVVVAAETPGVRDLIYDGRSGLLAARTSDALAAAIRRVLGNQELMDQIASAAAATVRERRFVPTGQKLRKLLS